MKSDSAGLEAAALEAAGLEAAAQLLVGKLIELVEDSGKPSPILLIDGRAGSGKSTLADAIKKLYFKQGESAPRVVHMDDLYPGWDGLEAGADYLNRLVLAPLAKGATANWQEWNWSSNEREGSWREFSGGTPLIIEGCGSLNRVSAELADLRVWLEVDETTRHERWLNREGNDEFWGRWSAQEVEFYAREKSAELADLTF